MRAAERVLSIALERHDAVSSLPFEEVVAGLHAGLGHPDFPALQGRLASTTDWEQTRQIVTAEAGSSGLMVFLELDLGRVIAQDPDAATFKAIRIIAGNPVTMESMARTTPQAGAFAPVTILVFEALDGVHVRYDTMVSATGGELTEAARPHAEELDRSVLALIASAL